MFSSVSPSVEVMPSPRPSHWGGVDLRVVSGREMRRLEMVAVKELGISVRDLMERAGRAVADSATEMLTGGEVVVICGKGNNGGDGFVASRFLCERGLWVKVFTLSPEKDLSSAAADAFKALKDLPLDCRSLTSENLEDFRAALQGTNLVIDAIFGIGFEGATKGLVAEVIKEMNLVSCPVLSVDVPSGLEANTGSVQGACIKADRTVTFICPKVGLVIYPGADFVGELEVAGLGVPEGLIERASDVSLSSPDEVRTFLPTREVDVHKKACGRVLVVAGSIGMTGAASLTSLAALRSGAGLVTLGIPGSLNSILEEKVTEVMTVPLPETASGSLSLEALDPIEELIPSFDVLALGPGLSREAETVSLVLKLVESVCLPLVLDADGLNALMGRVDILSKRSYPTVITPHPGELAGLFGITAGEVQLDRLQFTRRAAKEWDVVIVLKGARSIVGSSQELVVNTTGNPGMATAGTGDVLTGLIAGLLSQGVEPFKAAVLGTYLHGLAGDIAAQELTEYCLIAGDLLNCLPMAFKKLMAETGS